MLTCRTRSPTPRRRSPTTSGACIFTCRCTRDHLLGALDWMQAHPTACPHAEMETYTWEVLPAALRVGIEDQLVGEYEWTLAALGARGLA
jgi:hypothetical protein